jgi:hypothetical protein
LVLLHGRTLQLTEQGSYAPGEPAARNCRSDPRQAAASIPPGSCRCTSTHERGRPGRLQNEHVTSKPIDKREGAELVCHNSHTSCRDTFRRCETRR